MSTLRRAFSCAVLLLAPVAASTAGAQVTATPLEARTITKEAYIYAYPMVDNYRIMHAYFVDPKGPEYKAPFNTLRNIARVFTPEDAQVQTPNADTPYSFLGLDLRAEPLVLTVPPMDKDRYFSIQFIDLYTHNFDYVGSRTTGNDGGTFLVVGPGWEGEAPSGVKKVVHSESGLAFAIYRTQLFDPADIDNVKKIQAGYKVQTLSAFLGKPAPKAAPPIDFVQPMTVKEQKSSIRVFEILNFVLQFCPTHPSEEALMARFAKIGVGAGKPFDVDNLSVDIRNMMEQGIADAWDEVDVLQGQIAAGEVTSSDAFGTREYLRNNYLYRMVAAVVGIYGNSKVEAIYPIYTVDVHGDKLFGNKRYTLHFAPGHFPPVNAFWSLTLYELPASLLSANPINRYLVNSPMLPEFKRDDDSGVTLLIQHEPPGKEWLNNWLPAPRGAFFLVLRLYWPKAEALEGKWNAPPLLVAK